MQLTNPCICYIDDSTVPHSWFNIDENDRRICISTFRAGNIDEIVSDTALANKTYTGNTLADEITTQPVHYADTSPLEITTQSKESFKLSTDRA